MTYTQLEDGSAAFRRCCGVEPETFEIVLKVLEEAEKSKKKAGRPSKLSLADQLLLTLSYWREHRTQVHLAASYGLHGTTATRVIKKAEEALVGSGRFSLPRRVQGDREHDWAVAVLDSSETPIERPKQSSVASLKPQVLTDYETSLILGLTQAPGPCHGLQLFREHRMQPPAKVWYLADGGYRGLAELHRQTVLPVRKARGKDLSAQDMQNNRRLAKLHIRVEYVVRGLKCFRIRKERYRSRRKRFGLRSRPIAAPHNCERALP